jgi:hypothetical protein
VMGRERRERERREGKATSLVHCQLIGPARAV